MPALWLLLGMVLLDMKLISGKDEGAVFIQIQLHHNQAGRMPWGMMQRNTLEQLQLVFFEGFPVHLIQL